MGSSRIRNEEERLFAIQIGEKMGVNSSVITELKKGNIKKPSFELMCKIADALEVSLDVFRKE